MARVPESETPSISQGISSRRTRVPQQARSRRTREAVLDAAMDCFEQGGFDDTTTAMIAARAGIAVGTLYAYFEDKRQILLELLDVHAEEMADMVIVYLDPETWRGRDPRDHVRQLIDLVFHSQRLRPGMQRIMWERYFKDDDFRVPFEAVRARIREAIERFFDAVAERGRLRDLDRERASFVVLNAVQWNATQAFMYGTQAEIDATAEATADLVARYLFDG
jgi:AcrR family transcriptional regulator